MKNSEKLNSAFGEVDSKYIEKTASAPKRKKMAMRILTAAVLSALALTVMIPLLKPSSPPVTALTPTQSTTVPTEPAPTVYNPNYIPPEYPNALFSVNDIVNKYDMIPGTYSSTTSYKKIWYPEYLYLAALPESDTVDIFEIDYDIGEYDAEELVKFDEKYKRIFEEYFDSKLEYSKHKKEDYWYGEISNNDAIYRYAVSQSGVSNNVTITQKDDCVLYIGDKTIDASMSDDEILSIIKEYSSDIANFFDFEFKDIKVYRNTDLYIRCYNKNSEFGDGNEDAFDRQVGSQILFDVSKDQASASYTEYRVDPNEYIKKTDSVKKLSLEEAYELLINGYCFGAHTCPKCMQNNTPVDFSEYDYVGLEYLFGIDPLETGDPMPVLPFYVFYKEMEGEVYNGGQLYAKTWVPMIELSGMKEYFDNLLHK